MQCFFHACLTMLQERAACLLGFPAANHHLPLTSTRPASAWRCTGGTSPGPDATAAASPPSCRTQASPAASSFCLLSSSAAWPSSASSSCFDPLRQGSRCTRARRLPAACSCRYASHPFSSRSDSVSCARPIVPSIAAAPALATGQASSAEGCARAD